MAQPSLFYRLLLVVFLVFVSSLSVGARTVLTIAGHQTTWTTVEPAAKEYMALHPDVVIEHLYIRTDNYEGMSKILTMTVGGDLPDMIHASLALSPELLAGGVFAPVPADLASEAERFFLKPLIPTVMYQGRMFGIPTENQTYVLGYNQRLFDEAGLAGVPGTWSELAAFARKLTKTDGQGRLVQTGFGISGVNDYIRFSNTFLNLLWSNDGTYIDDHLVAHLNKPAARETVEFLKDMYSPGHLSFSNTMRNEKAAMASTPTYYRGSLIKLADYPYMRTTLFPSNKGPKVAYQYGWAMFVTSNTTESETAWDFVRFLTMDRGPRGTTRMGDQLISAVGALPTSRADLARDVFRTDPFFAGFVASLDVSKAEPIIPQVALRQDEMFKALKPAIEGRVPVTQAVEDAQMRVTNILNSFAER